MTAIAAQRGKFWSFDRAWPWLLPMVSMLLIFTIYPLLYDIWLSFHEYAPFKRSLVFVGFDNWSKLFADSRMWASFGVTMVYFVIVLSIELVLGMALALLLDNEGFGMGFLRGVLTLTLVVPPAITGMMFLLMEDPSFGVLSFALNKLGLLGTSTPILSTSSTALWGVIVADVWQWTPFMVLIFMAGLRSLPPEPFEAAMIDGASSWQIFRRLTLPMLGKVIAVAVLIRGIDIYRMFDYVYVMTSGGPGTATYTLSLYAWQQTFSFIKWGYGATIGLLMLFVILVVSNLFIKISRVKW